MLFVNDSKATTPHAAITALRGFRRVVLLAGGLNKGLDLSSLATEHERVKAVVGLGTAADDVTNAFAPFCHTEVTGSMASAVEAAADAQNHRARCRCCRSDLMRRVPMRGAVARAAAHSISVRRCSGFSAMVPHSEGTSAV